MRIGLIIYGELTQHPGSYLFDRYLVRGLSRVGHTIDVISLRDRDYGRNLLDNLSLRLRRQLSRSAFDVLLQDESNHPSLFYLNRSLNKRAAFPIVSIVHGLRCRQSWPGSTERQVYTRIERDYFATLDGVILKSQETRNEVQKLVGTMMPFVIASPGRDHLQPDLDESAAHARAHEGGPLRLLFLGDVVRNKGLHFLLAGLAALEKSEVRLDVVGDLQADPTYVRETQATIVREGLTQVVTLWGTLKGDSLYKRLRLAQALTVTSEAEGFSMAYLEAMGFYLPILASHDGAVREIITDGTEGFLVNRRRPDAIATAIKTWVDDRDRLAQMSTNSHNRFVRQPTWEQTAERVQDFLEERVRRFRS
ncbi:MAG: glycosyltransferase family 4 protein [Myxococcota bacterium]